MENAMPIQSGGYEVEALKILAENGYHGTWGKKELPLEIEKMLFVGVFVLVAWRTNGSRKLLIIARSSKGALKAGSCITLLSTIPGSLERVVQRDERVLVIHFSRGASPYHYDFCEHRKLEESGGVPQMSGVGADCLRQQPSLP